MHPKEHIQNIAIFRGEARMLRFRLTRPTVITDWTARFIMRDRANTSITFTYDAEISGNIDNAETIGVFDVPLTASNTTAWSAKTYAWTFERMDTGSERVMAYGELKAINK